MFPMTPALKDHLVKTFGLKADATDDEALKFAATKFGSGELTAEKVKELTASPDRVGELKKMITETVAEAMKGFAPKPTEVPVVPPVAPVAPAAGATKTPAELETERMAAFQTKMTEMETRFEARMAEKAAAGGGTQSSPSPVGSILKMGVDYNKDDAPDTIRVKSATARYDGTTKGAFRKGISTQPLIHNGVHLDEPSQLRKAMARTWFKFELGGQDCQYLNEHEKDLLRHILTREKFYADGDTQEARFLTERERHEVFSTKRFEGMTMQKAAILDSNTSGGSYAVPQFFDYDLILLPILGNELAPLCNIVDVPKGDAATGYTMDNFAFTSGSTEGTAITLATTTSYIGQHNTTFYRAAVGVEIGLNWLEDAAPNILDNIIARIQAKAAEWADEQVAFGDGTTEPQGIMNASGTIDVTLNTPTTGPYVISDVLNLLFGVSKAYRNNHPRQRAAFGMTDVTYKKLRSIATGVTGDTRLIFGEDIEGYTLFGHRASIIGTGLTNDDLFFCQAGGYRLYRRQPVRIRRIMDGVTLFKTNTMVAGADMRWGGQLDRGGYAAVATSGIP